MNNDQMITKLPPQDIAKLFNIPVSKREAALAVMLANLEPRNASPLAAESELQFRSIKKTPVVAEAPVIAPKEVTASTVLGGLERGGDSSGSRRPWKPVDAPSDANRAVFAAMPIEWGNGWRQPCASLRAVLGTIVDRRVVRGLAVKSIAESIPIVNVAPKMLNTGIELRLNMNDRW